MKTNTDKLEELANSGKLTINRMIFRPKKMTGQEWYDRFVNEWLQARAYPALTSKEILEIARKASNL